MKILFLPLVGQTTAQGSLSRCMSLAEEARKRGHEAAFVSHRASSGLVEAAGFRSFEAFPMPAPRDLPRQMHNVADALHWMGATSHTYIEMAVQAECRAVRELSPDVLFSETVLTASVTAAICDLPLISTAAWTTHPCFVSPLFNSSSAANAVIDGFNHVLARHGLTGIRDLRELFYLRSDLKIAPTSPEFEPELQYIPHLHYVGYLLSAGVENANVPGWLQAWDTSRPTVYVYLGGALGSPLGIGQIWPTQYLRIIPEAFDGSEFRVVFSIGRHPSIRELPEPTPNVRFEHFVPGMAMLGKSDLALFYGGQNTAMATLLCGVPSIIVPGQHFERDFNADCLVQGGAAIKLSMQQFQPKPLLAAARKMMAGHYRKSAQALGRSLRALGGPSRAFEIILENFPTKA